MADEKVRAFQLYWNEQNPNNKLVADGIASKKTEDALKALGLDSIDTWYNDWDFNKRYNTFDKPIMSQDVPLKTKSRHSAAYQAYLAGQKAYKEAEKQAKIKETIKNDITRRLAGLPNNVTTWKYSDDPQNDVYGLHFKTDNGYYTIPKQQAIQESPSTEDWEYRNAVMYRLFGDSAPMQQYNTREQSKEQSMNNAMYNLYIRELEDKEEKRKEKQEADEKARIAAEEKENKNKEVVLMFDDPENTENQIKDAIIKKGLNVDDYKEMFNKKLSNDNIYAELLKSISGTIKTEKEKTQLELNIDKADMPKDYKAYLKKILNDKETEEKKTTDATREARRAKIVEDQGKKTQTNIEISNIVKNKTPLHMLSKEQRQLMLKNDYIYVKDKGWFKK